MSILDLFTTSKYWLIACAVCLAVGGGIGWHEKALRVPALLEAQKTADQKECNIDKQKTRKANDQLQNDRDRIAADLATYKRVHPMRCIIPAGQPDARSSGPEYAGGDGAGISTDWLRDYAARCEIYRSEVSVCISFLAEERKSR